MVKLIAEGFTSEEIGEQRFISKKTVDRQRENARYAIRRGLVTP